MHSLPLPLAAFFAGILSFLSPCVLPLVPGYVSLISGASVEELQSSERRVLGTVMLHSVTFVLGFSVVFIALGAVATGVGQVVNEYHSLLSKVAGIIVIIFGLHLTGILKIKALYADKRLHDVKGSSSAVGLVCRGICLRFRMDALHRSHSGNDSGIGRRAGDSAERHCAACSLLTWTGGPVPADLVGSRSFPGFL